MKKLSKAIALVLVLVLGLSTLSGCSKTVKTEDSSTSAKPTAGVTTDTDSTTTEAVNPYADKETLKIKIAGHITPMNLEYGVATDPITQMLNEKFNIEIEIVDGTDSSDWGTRLSALMASNELPDIFSVPNPNIQMPILTTSKQVMDLTPYLTAELAPNLTSDNKAQASINLIKLKYGDNQAIYGLGMARGTWDSGAGATVGDFIRWDLYKELGYPEIKTEDDLLNVLKQMQDKFPKTADGKKAYAIGTWFGDAMGWGDWLMRYKEDYTSQNGTIDASYMSEYDKVTGNIVDGNQLKNPEGNYWRTIRFYNKAYQMGILDPESFTQKYDVFDDKCKTGRYYYINPGWLPAGYQSEYNKAGLENIGFALLPGIGSDVQTIKNEMVEGERLNCVSVNTADPERVVALLDYISSYEFSRIATNGMEGVYWEMVNGVPTAKPELYDTTIEEEDRKAASGMAIYHHFLGYAGGTIDPVTNTPISLLNTTEPMKETLSQVQKDQLEFYKAPDLITAFAGQLKQTSSIQIYGISTYTDDMKTKLANLADYMFKNQYLAILAKSDAEFNEIRDKMMSEIDQFDVDEIYEFQHSALLEQQEEFKPILELYNK